MSSGTLVAPREYDFYSTGTGPPPRKVCDLCDINPAEWIVMDTLVCTDCKFSMSVIAPVPELATDRERELCEFKAITQT